LAARVLGLATTPALWAEDALVDPVESTASHDAEAPVDVSR
jgi:hypothetical protein